MKRILLKIMLLLTVQSSLGQFHAFSHKIGFTHSRGATISHIAMAGGGVVLKGVAKPKYPDSIALFTGITIKEYNGLSTMYIQTKESNMFYSDSAWLMRDAAMLVKSEKKDTMYRDVNLFGKFSKEDINLLLKEKQSKKDYYAVEMVESLRNTRSGQTLLYMDIMLSSQANTRYYSTNRSAAEKYEAARDSLINIFKAKNDSLEKTYFKFLLEARSLYSKKKSGKLSNIEYKKQIREIADSISKLKVARSWNDYTYNDENTNYTFFCTKQDKQIYIDGEPNYTFLSHIPFYVPVKINSKIYHIRRDSLKVDSIFTNYFVDNHDLIKNLNYIVVTNAEHFGEIAAFYRYLKASYPKLWIQVYGHYAHTGKTEGDTPGLINMVPPDKQ